MISKTTAFILLSFYTTVYGQIESARLTNAIIKGNTYLTELPDSIFPSYNQKLMLKYLYRLYDSTHVQYGKVIQTPRLLNEDIPVYNFYQRIIADHHTPHKDSLLAYFNHSSGIEKLMIWGIYADVLPLDSPCMHAFDELLSPQTQTRNLAHASLSLHWSEKYRDSITSYKVQKYYTRYPALLKQGALQDGIITDTGMEGIVGLICLNKSTEIPFNWVYQILNAQNMDGSWSFNPSISKQADTHATLLALWILYDFKSKYAW